MKTCLTIVFLFFLTFTNGQELKIGKPANMTAFTVPVPLVVTQDYGVSVLLTKPFSLPMLSSFSSVKQIEFSYSDNFSLVKYNLQDFSEKKKHFSLTKKRSFKAFCSTNKSLLVISHHKDTKDNSLNYFIDVYDYETMENRVENKKIIKFLDGNRRKVIYFSENKNGFDIVFKNNILLNGHFVLDYFFINKDYKVIDYKKIRIESSNSKWEYATASRNNNSLYLLLTNNIRYKNKSGFYNTSGFLTIKKDTFEFVEDILPNNMSSLGVNLIGNHKESIRPIHLLINESNNIYSIYISNKEHKEDKILILPLDFKQSIKKVFLSLQNVIYTFKSLGNNVYSIETKIVSYQNSMGSFNSSEKTKYGPALIFKIDESDNISWSYLIENHRLNSDLTFASLSSKLYVFYSIQKAFVFKQIDLNSGLVQNINLGILSPENVAFTSVYDNLNDKLINLFYIRMHLKTQKPYHSPTIHPVIIK